jgi:hypothetical protein
MAARLATALILSAAAAEAASAPELDAAVAAAQGFPVVTPQPSSAAGKRARLASAAAPGSATKAIVLVVADDLGYSDLGYRGSQIATPVIDHLALHGVRIRAANSRRGRARQLGRGAARPPCVLLAPPLAAPQPDDSRTSHCICMQSSGRYIPPPG